jgi:alkylation response protein AidB-like acyl-CoA dehydrogenase
MMKWDNTTLFPDDNEAARAFRKVVREWIEANVPRELCNRLDRIDPPELKPWHRKLYERGWIAPHWPKEYGGMGATFMEQIILYEEITRVDAPTPQPHGLNFIGPIIIQAGTPEQKARHLPTILTGDITWCQGYSEPGAGSDLASLKMRAVLEGASFVVDGQKTWTTNGQFADWMFALVRTDPDAKPRHAGISMLLIDMKSPGITVRPIKSIKGDAEFAEEFFDNVSVPMDNLLGNINEGWRLANMLLGAERFTNAHPRLAAVFLNKARQVAQFSGAINDPSFVHQLASLETDLLAFTAYYRHAAQLNKLGRAPLSMASVMKLGGSALAQRASELIMHAAGPVGPQWMDLSINGIKINVPAEVFEGRRFTVGGGSLEIQRNILAKRALDLPS